MIGELALLTGSPRSATVRSPEHAELFAVDKAVFLDLMDVLPAFSRNLCVVLAKRLEATTLKVPRASGKQLQGNLRYFDLATVIQTLIGSHQTGLLVVTQDKHKLAEIFFYHGNIARARYRQLAGDDAVFQLFQSPVEGEFSFTGREVREEEVQSEISMPAISLLMESVRMQDELPMLQERLPGRRARLPPEGDAARLGRARVDRAGGLRLVAAQEGREPVGAAARRAALDLLDLPDGRDAAGERPDPVMPASFRARFVVVVKAKRRFLSRAVTPFPSLRCSLSVLAVRCPPAQTLPASRISWRSFWPSARASSSSAPSRVIALRLARNDQFAASSAMPDRARSRPTSTAVPRRCARP